MSDRLVVRSLLTCRRGWGKGHASITSVSGLSFTFLLSSSFSLLLALLFSPFLKEAIQSIPEGWYVVKLELFLNMEIDSLILGLALYTGWKVYIVPFPLHTLWIQGIELRNLMLILAMLNKKKKKIPCPLLNFSQSDYLIRFFYIN